MGVCNGGTSGGTFVCKYREIILNIYYSGGPFLPEAKYMPIGNIGRSPAGGMLFVVFPLYRPEDTPDL
ncbi:hypothetical protein AC094_30980 [Bacteroides fragilis]|uniref:Uncharacterized protein n=1 Tax=Bacteroides fragilis TaxID=817 RepID=A0A853PSR2_BACFG|nr:hypothetical protein AC094_30980 [Bacteroides fragilis]